MVEIKMAEPENKAKDGLLREAKRIAGYIIKAYIYHDSGDFERASYYFMKFFEGLFPEYIMSKEKLENAGRAYARSLWEQDFIEDDDSLSEREKLEDERWYKKVYPQLEEVCKSLDLDTVWAHKTTQFFKYHGVLKDSPSPEKRYKYLAFVHEANKVFTIRITGDDYWARSTSGLYDACIASHDMHDHNGLEEGKRLTTELVYIWLLGKRRLDREHRGVKPLGGKKW